MPAIEDTDLVELSRIGEEIARDVGALVARMRAERVDVAATKSSVTDVVTQADLAAEARVRELLATHRPADGVLGEEGSRQEGTSGITWVVDPIDGTVNYLYGRPEYCVSVAAVLGDPQDVVNWRVLAGCVHAPELGVTYRAAAGHGAERNGVRLSGPKDVDLSHALIGTGFSYSARVRAEQGRVLAGVIPAVRDIRRVGAGALDLCDVASGRLDAHVERGLNPWDVAAAFLVLAEVGASVRVTPRDDAGQRLTLAAHPNVIEEVARVFGIGPDQWEERR